MPCGKMCLACRAIAAGLAGLLALAVATTSQGQNRANIGPTRDPAPAVVAAWKKAGARFGYSTGLGGFTLSRPAAGLAAFEINQFQTSPAELPLVDVPFALTCYIKTGDAELKGLARQKNLRHLDLDSSSITAEGLKELAGLKLQTLTIPAAARTDLGLKNYLAAIEPPTELNLSAWKVSDAGLEVLKGLKLKSLRVPPAAQTDLGLKHLVAAVEAPQELNLNGWKISPQSLSFLRGLNVEQLSLPYAYRDDDGLKSYLAAVAPQTKLELSGWKVTDLGLEALADQKQLQTLDLTGRKITDAGLKKLAGLQALVQLQLGRTAITGAGLAHLADLKNLKVLTLSYTRLHGGKLKVLSRLSKLELLRLADTGLPPGELKELAKLRTLTHLDISSLPVSDETLREIAGLPDLRILDVNGTSITNAGIQHLAGMQNLEYLHCSGTKVTVDARKILVGMKLKRVMLPAEAPLLVFLEGECNRLINADVAYAARCKDDLRKFLDEAIAKRPQDAEPYLTRARFRRIWDRNPAGSEADLKTAMKLAPGWGEVHLEMVVRAQLAEKPAEAKRQAAEGFRLYKAALEREGLDPSLNATLISLAMHAEQWSDVVAMVTAAAPVLRPRIENRDRFTPLQRMRGLSYLALGKTQEANADLYAAKVPQHEIDAFRKRSPQLRLADAWKLVNWFDDAAAVQTRYVPPNEDVAAQIRSIEEQVAADPGSAESLALRGAMKYMLANDPVGAREDLLNAVELEPQRPTWRLHLVRCYRKLKEDDKANNAAKEGYQLRLAEREKLSSPPQPDDELIALAFHARQWQDVVALCRPVLKDRNGYFQDPYFRYLILALYAQGQNREADAIWTDVKSRGGYARSEYFAYDVRYFKAQNPQLKAADVFQLLKEQADASGVTDVRDEYVRAMLPNLIGQHPDFGPAYLMRAEMKWAQRRRTMAFPASYNAYLDLPSDYETKRAEIEKTLKVQSVADILGDIAQAEKLGMKKTELDSLRLDVLDNGEFILGWPQTAPLPIARLVSLERHIDSLDSSIQAFEVDRKDPMKHRERYQLYERLADGLRESGDLLGAAEVYGKLIQGTHCEYNPGIGLPDPVGGIYTGSAKNAPPEVIAHRARVAKWYVDRGKLYDRMGRGDEARLDFAMALTYEPGLRKEIDAFRKDAARKQDPNPRKTHALRLKMWASEYEARQRTKDAIGTMKRAVTLDPNCDPTRQLAKLAIVAQRRLLAEAKDVAGRGRAQDAAKLLQEALELRLNNFVVRQRLAEGLAQAGDYTGAAVQYDWLVRIGEHTLKFFLPPAKLDPSISEADARLAIATYKNLLLAGLLGRARAVLEFDVEARHAEGALADLNRLADQWPQVGEVFVERGKCLLVLGRLDQAEADFKRAATLDKNANARIEQARKWAQAHPLADQQRAAAERYLKTASLRWDQKDHEGALTDCTAGLASQPNHQGLLTLRARVFMQAGKPKEAAEDLQRIISLLPALPPAKENAPDAPPDKSAAAARLKKEAAAIYLSLGEAQLAAKSFPDAVGSLTKSIELDPTSYQPYLIRFRALLAQGKFENASQDMLRAHERRKNPQEHDWNRAEYLAAILDAVMARRIDESRMAALTGIASVDGLRLNVARYHRDPAAKARYWRVAASRGNAEAMMALGRVYHFGYGAPRNYPEARKWFANAKRAGATEAEAFEKLLALRDELASSNPK